jgi:DNA recombination protein RmuC
MLEDVVRLNDRVRKLGSHFEQARGDVDQIRISTEGIVRHGERIRAVELGEVKVELAPILPSAEASGE